MKTLGGYLGMEFSGGLEYHDQLIKLNTGRHALEYILRVNKYSLVHLPYYCCDALLEPIKKLGLKHSFYAVNNKLEPTTDIAVKDGECFLYINYFGVKDDTVSRLCKEMRNLIIDNSQAFFSRPEANTDTFYSCRKFFGVPDGAYAQTNAAEQISLEREVSFASCSHLLKYYDTGIESGYGDFLANEARLSGTDMNAMSAISQAIMAGIDYDFCKRRREDNFQYLHNKLAKINELNINFSSANGPLCYPLLVSNPGLRKALISEKIFIPDYWPNVRGWTTKENYEYFLSDNLVALPVDQRYDKNDMDRIIDNI